MSDFPSTKSQVLALEWLRQQDTRDLSPEEFADKYDDACRRIAKRKRNKNDDE